MLPAEHRNVIVLDSENNGLLKEVTKVHVVTFYDLATESWSTYIPDPNGYSSEQILDVFCEALGNAGNNVVLLSEFPRLDKRVVCHNILDYDRRVFSKLLDVELGVDQCIDTLILSKLESPARKGGHGLAAWGERYGIPKPKHEDWSVFSLEMLRRNIEDIKINAKLYEDLMSKFVGLESVVRIEHDMQMLALSIHDNGFYLDRELTEELYTSLDTRCREIEDELQRVFPPKPDPKKTVEVPYSKLLKKDGTRSKRAETLFATADIETNYDVDGEHWVRFEFLVPFNLNSGDQRCERLMERGWKPREFTETGKPRFSSKTLIDDDPSEAHLLGEYMFNAKMRKTVGDWLFKFVDDNGYVHCRIDPLRARTHRAGHSDPNLGNIKRVKVDKETGEPLRGSKGKYGYECRAAFTIEDPDNNVLVGVDATAIQFRGLAHYIDDPDYTRKLLETDVHQTNADILGITRETAKTWGYALTFGGGDWKLGATVGYSEDEVMDLRYLLKNGYNTSKNGHRQKLEDYFSWLLPKQDLELNDVNLLRAAKGRSTKEVFYRAVPGYRILCETKIPEWAEQGWIPGLDGRRVLIESERQALDACLQSFERIVMGYAGVYADRIYRGVGIPYWFRNMVHDEYQIETTKDQGHFVGQVMVDMIKYAGEELGAKCPMDGEYKLAKTWADSH